MICQSSCPRLFKVSITFKLAALFLRAYLVPRSHGVVFTFSVFAPVSFTLSRLPRSHPQAWALFFSKTFVEVWKFLNQV